MSQRGRYAKPAKARSGFARLLDPVDRVLDWGEHGPVRGAAVQAILVALLGGCIVGGLAAWDWIHVRGWPVESATIVKLVHSDGQQHCGKADWEDYYDRTWVSANPPPGLPSEFTDREGCDVGSVGDVEDVVRVVHDDGSVHVWVDPATSLADVALFSLVGLVGGWGLAFVFLLIRNLWRGRRRRRRRWRRGRV